MVVSSFERVSRRTTLLFITILLATAASGPARADDHLRVARPSAIGFGLATVNVGVAAGIFHSHGLDVEVLILDGSAKQHQAMIAGAIDITLGAGTDLAFVAKGAPEKGVAAIAGPPLNFGATVRNDGKINTVADLKGKKISATTVGSITYWFANQISVREGWTGADALQIVPLGNFDGARAALKTGDIDAISATMEGGLLMQKEGAGKVLLAYGDIIKTFLTHVAFATDDLMKRHPDQLRRFLKGWFETVAWMKTHKEESVRFAMAATNLPLDIANQSYDREQAMFSVDGRFDPKAVAIVMQSLVETGALPSIPDNGTLFTEEFLN